MDDVRDEPRTGVWVHHTGTRVETTKRDDGWHIAVYMSATGGQPGHESVFADPAQVEAKLADLEAQGYAYQAARTPADSAAAEAEQDDQWSTKNVLLALAAAVVIVVIGVMVLS